MSGELQISVSTMVEGTNEWDWMQARTAHVPGEGSLSVTIMNQTLNRFVHDYGDIYQTISRDHGGTWSAPAKVPSLQRAKTADGYEWAPSDMWNQWHPKSGMVVAAGVSFHFAEGRHEHQLRRQVAYAVMDPSTTGWGSLQALELPERDQQPVSAGTECRLQPARRSARRRCVVTRELSSLRHSRRGCEYLRLLGRRASQQHRGALCLRRAKADLQGTRHTTLHNWRPFAPAAERRGVEFSARGLAEPSLAAFDGAFFLTLRSDHSAFVTKGNDGINFDQVREWTFDDGEILGSYCTQQHWATIGGRLYLLYCRPTGRNDHIFRHRAPIFIAEVDPERLQVIRDTERAAIPENNAGMGNFGVCQISDTECWVTCGDGMRSGARKGDVNKVMLSKVVAV